MPFDWKQAAFDEIKAEAERLIRLVERCAAAGTEIPKAWLMPHHQAKLDSLQEERRSYGRGVSEGNIKAVTDQGAAGIDAICMFDKEVRLEC